MNNNIKHIAIMHKDGIEAKEELLSNKFNIPIIKESDVTNVNDFFAVLFFNNNKLCLKQTGKDAPGAIYVDFVEGAANHRRKFGGGKSQMLAKAIGLKKYKNPYILDATAGLGRDAFVLACLGCKVDMIERNPLVHALLENGIERALNDEEVHDIAERMMLINSDSFKYIENLDKQPDIIYLDPMFPDRDKSALVKKEMRIFKELLGSDEDSDKLLETSLTKAKYRVVVKRPRKSPNLMNKEPNYKMEGKANRFDIYVIS
jgi:16S rRNA (guanine1516-N2)-methyltransferase